jgi:hypothetical protein
VRLWAASALGVVEESCSGVRLHADQCRHHRSVQTWEPLQVERGVDGKPGLIGEHAAGMLGRPQHLAPSRASSIQAIGDGLPKKMCGLRDSPDRLTYLPAAVGF